ncbi:MAG: anti-sigma factor [Vicinamibacterales bacterium]
MTHDEARDAMPLFVVDADDAETRTALLAHVAGCEACREALREYETTADALGQAVPQVRPRPELRARTLEAITGSPSPAQARPASDIHAVEPASREASRGRWAPWLAAAAALVAAVSVAGLVQTRQELADVRATVAIWQARVADAERNAQAAQTSLVGYQRQLRVMTADDLLLVSLSGVPPAASAQAKAFVSRSQNAILFTVRDLPPPPAARVYQLWAIAGGQPISAGTFVPDASGRTQLVAEVPALTERPAALAVTLEPEGGVPSPTGPSLLRARRPSSHCDEASVWYHREMSSTPQSSRRTARV